MVPGPLLAFFLGIFWIVLVTGIVLCILIAITSPAEESFFWFICSACLLLIGIVSTLFPGSIALLFVIAIAVLAFYAGYSGISLALTHPHHKYYLVGGVIVASLALLWIFITYVPSVSDTLVMTVVGTFSFVFGLFAILMGLTLKEGTKEPVPPHVLILKTCKFPIKSPDAPSETKESASGNTQEDQNPK